MATSPQDSASSRAASSRPRSAPATSSPSWSSPCHGTLLNLSGLGRDLGLTDNTVKAWLSVLEASQQIVLLRPYFANIGRRLVKTPKVYFLDTGTVSYLVGLSDVAHASREPMAGTLMESLLLGELVKTYRNRGDRALPLTML